jgi:glutathione synthase/RimK-type ligase-like ATP-grasp enzyme
MPDVLLATCADLPDGDEDAAGLLAALETAGVRAAWAAWDDPSIDWAAAPVVLRSTWDYTFRRDAFLAWARSVPWLHNPFGVVSWNSDKTYLRDLDAAGVPIVPTTWGAPGELVALPETGEYVVKPSVGAGSRGAGRFVGSASAAATAHVTALHEAGRVVLVQPYLAQVDAVGETALIYIDGEFSHAVRKGAMLPAGVVHPVNGYELFVEEKVKPHDADAAELRAGAAAVRAVRERFGGDLLYARVDLLPSADGPVLVELELTEPSLFLGHAVRAADRFAAAIARRI